MDWYNGTRIEKIWDSPHLTQVRKNSIDDYWSTNSYMETPNFGKVISRNRFRQTQQSIHFCNSEEIPEIATRTFKVGLKLNYFLDRFAKVYKPKENLSLDEVIIPYRGRLKFHIYNLAKLKKYGQKIY